jgi:Domain of unknown function (DUF4062)
MASEPIYKVFVSSTFRDLCEERAEVQKALLKLNCLPVGMELFPAADDDTWDFIKDQINDSDYYVALVAGRYGSLAQDGISFTEKEYDYAREREIPSIGFVHADRAKIPSGQTENDPEIVKKLDAFINKIKKRPVREFMTPHQLASEVTTSFVDLKRTKPRIGFVRTNEAVDYRKYAELLEKNAELEKQLIDLRTNIDRLFPGCDETIEIVFDGPAMASVTATWKYVFLKAASIILQNSSEDLIAKQLAVNIDKIQNANNSISKEGFQLIKERLFALNLIDVWTDHFPSTTTITNMLREEHFWKLTEYGRRQFALLRLSRLEK